MVAKNLILGIASVATLTLMIVMTIQPVLAPRNCGGCTAFKKLTHEFEKNVKNLLSSPPPDSDRQLAMLFNDYEQAAFKVFGIQRPQ